MSVGARLSRSSKTPRISSSREVALPAIRRRALSVAPTMMAV
jgi:hypothetical protein